jgi:hypothetical protein
MITNKEELSSQFKQFADTHEIVENLNYVANDMDGIHAADKYWVQQGVKNITGLFDLCRSLLHHLNDCELRGFDEIKSDQEGS